MHESVRIRREDSKNLEELAKIRSVNEAAFGGLFEADLVDKLRGAGQVLISLVAEAERSIAGHIVFSRMWIDTAPKLIPAVALAPVAVLPVYQRKGFGSQLITTGLGLLRDRRETIVIVVGHPSYYPQFGFSADKASHLKSPFPPDAFMALELRPGTLDGIRGSVVYPAAFGI